MRVPWNKVWWNDEWIAENYLRFRSYREMAEAYNAEFGTTITENAVGGRARSLGLKKPRVTGEYLTEEQKKFIEEYYPHHSVEETTRAFNERFGTNKKKCTMKNYAQRHGLKVDEDVVTESKLRAAHKEGSKRALRKIGDVRFDGRYWVIKTEEGWKPVHKAVWEENIGKVKPGYAVIYLDGDRSNYDIDNLLEVPIRYIGMLDKNGMRSSNAEITKTGVMWCQLYEAIGKEKRNDRIKTCNKKRNGIQENKVPDHYR